MKFRYIILSLAVILTACDKQEIPTPETAVSCSIDYINHSKNEAYTNLLQQYTAKGIVGLTLLVDNPNEPLWAGSAGFADIENDIKMTPCHLNYMASIIKTYIATIILQLEEEGKLTLDDKLQPYISAEILDEIPNGNDVTIRQLLQCRSGMKDVFEVDFLLDLLNNPTQLYTMESLMTYMYGVQPIAAPGEKHYYGDANFVLLSMIIEGLDGNDLIATYNSRIFQPLGLTNSYLINVPEQLPQGVAASYWDRNGNQIIENVSDYQVALVAGLEGTDGLITDVYDMNIFQRGLMDGTLLSADSYQKMMEVVDIPEGDSNQNYSAYGLGIAKVQLSDEIWYGSFGNHIGSAAMMLYNQQHNTSIVIVQNTGTFFNDNLKQDFFGHLILDIEAIAF